MTISPTSDALESPNSNKSNSSNNQLQPIDLEEMSQDQKNKIIAWTTGEYQKIKSARTRLEAQWKLNLAFYYGKQYALLTSVPGQTDLRLVTPQAPNWRPRPVFNRIRPIIRTELAKCTSQKPTAEVIPATADEEDLFASRAAEQIWESVYYAKRVNSILSEAVFWTLITGTGFIKDWWDDSKLDPMTGEQGDIGMSAETPWHIMVPDFRAEDIEDQPYVMHVSVRDAVQVNMQYGTNLEGDTKGSDDILQASVLDLSGTDKATKDGIMTYEVWVKPGTVKMFPMGAMFTVAGNTVLQAYNGWPYAHNEYPFSKISHIPKGQFYAESTITDLISPQREYNRTRAQIIEAKNKMSKPQLLAPVGSVDAGKITTEPGQVIYYRPGFTPPTPLPLQNLPAYVLQELDRLNIEFDDISGQHEVSRGQTPTGVTAATAINYLQEQDDSKLSHTIHSIESCMEKVGRHVIQYAVQFWDTPRTVRVVGSSGSFDVFVLKGSDLRGNTDLRVQAGSALPNSKAARQAFLMDLMKMGFIEPTQGLELMELGGVSRLYEELRIDSSQAQRENLRMQIMDLNLINMYLSLNDQLEALPVNDEGQTINPETGEPIAAPELPVPVNSFDNHQVHIDEHNRFRKSQAFESLPDEIKQLFELHVRSHVSAIMQSFMPGGDPTQVAPEFMDASGGQQQTAEEAPLEEEPEPTGDTLAGNPDSFSGEELPSG